MRREKRMSRAQQKAFYTSRAWRRARIVALERSGWLCEECKSRGHNERGRGLFTIAIRLKVVARLYLGKRGSKVYVSGTTKRLTAERLADDRWLLTVE